MRSSQALEEYLVSCPKNKTLIHWYDLYAGHFVVLEKEFQKKFFEKAIEKAGNYSGLGRKINISRKTISGCSNLAMDPTLKTLKKVATYLEYPFEEINEKIVTLGKSSNFRPKLPFNLHNSNGAEIRAAFLSDGHIDKNSTKPLQYCAYEIELHQRLIEICKETFGELETKTFFGHKTHVTRFPAAIGTALVLSGVPRGDKGKINPYLPRDILLGGRKMQAAYLRRAFDDEAYMRFDLKHNKRTIRLVRSTDVTGKLRNPNIREQWIRTIDMPKMIKHNLLEGEALLLSNFGIKTKTYPDGIYLSKKNNITAKWKIELGNQDSLQNFHKHINFTVNDKKEKLSKALTSYQHKKLPNGEGKKHALKVMQRFYKEKGHFAFGEVGREIVKTGRSFDLAGRYLKYFCENGIIKKTKRGEYTFK
ncbi:MAG: hypothetical protein AABW53_01080 [Nanoarchaeota archaeon]